MRLLKAFYFQKRLPTRSANRLDDRAAMLLLEIELELVQQVLPILRAPAAEPQRLADLFLAGLPILDCDQCMRLLVFVIPYQSDLYLPVQHEADELLDR